MRILLLLTLLVACRRVPESTPEPTGHGGHGGHVAPSATSEARGETAHWTVEGDTVRVNNTICAVSRAPLAMDKLGAFAATVTYVGTDSRFAGKKLVFNQCCEMCVEKFPSMWQADAEGIMRFHGLL